MRFRLTSGRAIGYRPSGAGSVIVFLHPIAMNSAFWTPVVEHLTSHRALAVDAMGHGDSDTQAGAFSLDDMAADVVELMLAVGNPPCIVAGCSMGGMVAQAIAVRAPTLVRGLVLLNTGHTLPAAGRTAMAQRAADARKGMPVILDATIDRWFSEDFRKARPDVVEATRAHLLTSDPIVHSEAWTAISKLDYEAKLPSLQCPALVMTGSADVSTPPALSQALVKCLKRGTYEEIAGAGHMAPLEQPELIARRIEQFAATLDKTSAA